MRIKLFLGILVIISFLSLRLFAQGINWQKGDFESILNKAKSEKKLVYVDIFTTWCGPCKQMDAEVFSNQEVGKTFNENFICYKIDGEKGDRIQ